MAGRVESLLEFIERAIWNDITNQTALARFRFQFWTVLLLAVVAVVAAISGWLLLGPLKPSATRARRAAAKVCAETVRDVLRENRGDYRVATCLPFAGDSTDVVFDEVFETLSSSGTFDVKPTSFFNRARRLFGLSLPGANDAKVAARKARRDKSDVAICGAVRRFETTPDGVELVLEYRLIDAATGKETFSALYDSAAARQAATVEKSESRGARRGWTTGELRSTLLCALWQTLATLAIPILFFPFLKGAAALRSNAANFFALLVCLLADLLCAWLLVAPTFQSWLSWLGCAGAAIFALWYNLLFLRLACRRTAPSPS